MTSKEIEELQERVYKISCGMFPLDMFFNDIRDNPNPDFDKDFAYRDLERIVDRVEKLEKAIVMLKEIGCITIAQEIGGFFLYICGERIRLIPEEYELLKEVF